MIKIQIIIYNAAIHAHKIYANMPLKYMHSYAKYIHKYFLYSLGYQIAWRQITDILYSWGNILKLNFRM